MHADQVWPVGNGGHGPSWLGPCKAVVATGGNALQTMGKAVTAASLAGSTGEDWCRLRFGLVERGGGPKRVRQHVHAYRSTGC